MSLASHPSHVYDNPITGQPMRPRRLPTTMDAHPECWAIDGNYLGATPMTWWDGIVVGNLAMMDAEHRWHIGTLVLEDYNPPAWIETEFAAFPSRSWWEWHWYRSIDPFLDRRPIPKRMRQAVIDRDAYVCGLCGGLVEPDDVHIDHILPVTLGGQNEMSNLQVAHSLCNISKGNRI